ncbi:MAG: peptidoglycan-binding protein [Umezawaea sp.]
MVIRATSSAVATDVLVRRGCLTDPTPILESFHGALPAYRTLAPGTTGADVTQFEQNLSALGYAGFTADDTYTEATATAVRKWQGDLGVTKTGTVDQGRIAHAAGPVRVDALKAAVGDPSRPGAAVLTCSGTVRLITVKLDVSDERLVVPGAAVTVALPNGKPATGKVTGSRTVVDPGDGKADPTTKIAVTVTPDDQAALTGLDQASVRVGFTASQRENVLTVPVAALLALPEGGYGVQVVQDGGTRIVPVRTGLFAAGRVEVSGDGLTEGMTVGMPA